MSGVNTYQSVEVGQATSVDCFRNIVNKTSKNPPEVWCFRQFFGGPNTFSAGGPGCLGIVNQLRLVVNSYSMLFHYLHPRTNGWISKMLV